MSELFEKINFEELDEISKKLYLITEKEINIFYDIFLNKLGFNIDVYEIEVFDAKNKTSNIFRFNFRNINVKREIHIRGRYQLKDENDFNQPKDSYDLGISIKMITEEFMWGRELFFVDQYIEDKYKINLTFSEENVREGLHKNLNLILDVSKKSEAELEAEIKRIMSMYLYCFNEDETLYKCLTGEMFIEGEEYR